MRIEELILHEDRGVRFTAILQDVSGEYAPLEKRPGIIVIPGGGYSTCSDREAEPVALAFAKEGFHVFILRYTVSKTDKDRIWPHPIEDFDEAVDLIREYSDKWHVDTDRLAVCGFSAGGHLAACAATIARNRPAAAILGYPALLDEVLNACAPNLPRPAEHIDNKTPPCFIFIARDDNIVDVRNATNFANALANQGISFELRVYSYGGHGFSTGDSILNRVSLSKRVKNWFSDSIGFLEEVWGRFTATGFTKPEIFRTVTGDYEDNLSVNCTI